MFCKCNYLMWLSINILKKKQNKTKRMSSKHCQLKSLRNAAMVATFLDLNKRSRSNIAEKHEKIDMYEFPVHDCTQEQNGSPYFSSIVRQCKWTSFSRKIVEIQKFCYHGNLTSRFPLILGWGSWCERVFFADRQAVGTSPLARQILKGIYNP